MMNKNNTKLILLTALISISNISLAEKAPFESSYEPLPSQIQYLEMQVSMMERVMSFLRLIF